MNAHRGWALAVFVVLATTGCALTDVDIVDFEQILVAEVYVTVAQPADQSWLRALVHGNAPGFPPSALTYPDAEVAVTDGDGVRTVLAQTALNECLASRPDLANGTCFAADLALASTYEAGEMLTLEVILPDGRRLDGSTTIPGAFSLDGIPTVCRQAPDTRFGLLWGRSEVAWAYVSETEIRGLAAALASEGIEAPDTVHLLGLSISESDTTVTFPSEFGVFDRFDLDQALAVRLQRGLPEGAEADVAVTAVDRNYVNWVRGGSFNPSGAVRVSSLAGDGSGVFAAAVTRTFALLSTTDPTAAPSCAQ